MLNIFSSLNRFIGIYNSLKKGPLSHVGLNIILRWKLNNKGILPLILLYYVLNVFDSDVTTYDKIKIQTCYKSIVMWKCLVGVNYTRTREAVDFFNSWTDGLQSPRQTNNKTWENSQKAPYSMLGVFIFTSFSTTVIYMASIDSSTLCLQVYLGLRSWHYVVEWPPAV